MNHYDQSSFRNTPYLSARAADALLTYAQAAGEHASPDLPDHVGRTLAGLALYGPHEIPERAFDAAALISIANHLNNPNNPQRQYAAALAELDYFTSPRDNMLAKSAEEQRTLVRADGYTGTLLGDGAPINRAADSYQERLAVAGIDSQSLGQYSGDWLEVRVGPNLDVVADTAYNNNVESIFSNAALLLRHLSAPNDDNRQLFRDVLRAETLYEPILEAWGYHAFHMLLSSESYKARVIGSGNESYLEHARGILDRVKEHSPSEIIGALFGYQPKSHLFHTDARKVSEERIIWANTDLGQVKLGDGELKSRVKTEGKMAWKMLTNKEYHNRIPPDPVGMLVVVEDEAQLAATLNKAIQRVAMNDRVELVASASKPTPLHIQGCERYIRSVVSKLDPDVRRYLPDELRPRVEFQVAKFYAKVHFSKNPEDDVLVEVQFQTKSDREASRIGQFAHMVHDSGDNLAAVIDAPEKRNLERIHARRLIIESNIGHLGVNERSIPNGVAHRKLLYRVAGL